MGLTTLRNAIFSYNHAKNLRNENRPVGLLVVFQNGEDGPADGNGSAVQGVDKPGAFLSGNFVTDVEPAGLIIGTGGGCGVLCRFAVCYTPRPADVQVQFP